MELTDSAVRDLEPDPDRPLFINDAVVRKLRLNIQPTGRKTWYLVYYVHRKLRYYRIGKADAISVDEANEAPARSPQEGEMEKRDSPDHHRALPDPRGGRRGRATCHLQRATKAQQVSQRVASAPTRGGGLVTSREARMWNLISAAAVLGGIAMAVVISAMI
jgi:hypothetical protein